MKNIPSKPRLKRCLEIAIEFIQDQEIYWFPVNPEEIANRNGWKLQTATEVASPSGMPVKNVLKGKDGNVFYNAYDQEYKIVYDDDVSVKSRIRWTIMHEIGHIVLGHLRDFEQNNLWRGGVTNKEHWVLERETNIFTAEVLAPMAILMEVKTFDPADILRFFQLSKEASENRQNDIVTYGLHISYIMNSMPQLRDHFKLYIAPVAICSRSNLDLPERLIGKMTEVIRMYDKAPYAKVNQVGRFWECPKCRNTDFSTDALYCKMCGHYLFNDCQNHPDDYNDNFCGKRNQGDARYCESCGNETYLLKAGLIMSWEEVVAELGDVHNGVDSLGKFEPEEKKPISDDG